MKLDKDIHREMMLKILADISKDPMLANNIGFKGGTACYFIYGLDRFSVDLDFDVIDLTKKDTIHERLLNLLGKYGSVKTKTSIKLNYSNEYQALKIDISTRDDTNDLNTYKVREIMSQVSVKVLTKEDMFAHKLVALTDRGCVSGRPPVLANRDLYDINFFFNNNWKYNKEIISALTGKTALEYFKFAYDFVDRYVNEQNILDRLGELVDDKKREWIKKNLKSEVLTHFARQIKVLEFGE